MAQTVKDVMTKDLVTVEPDTTVAEAARLMKERDVGALVIEQGGTVRGLVTDRDIVVRAVAEGREGARTRVEEVCSDSLKTVAPDEPIERAIEEMRRSAVRRLPVVQDGRPVGIVSLGDLAVERDERSALGHISAAPSNR